MLTASWQQRLASPRTRKVLLCTILPAWAGDTLSLREHIALEPSAFRFSTHQNAIVDGIPFWPQMVDWPTLSSEVDPLERAAPTGSTSVRFLPGTDLPTKIVSEGGPQNGFMAIDLWTDGLSLDEVEPLHFGPITGRTQDRQNGAVTVDSIDGDALRKVEFLGERITLDLDNFPHLPPNAIGSGRRQTVIGPLTQLMPAFQVDQSGHRFYVCDPPLRSGPWQVYVGGELVPSNEWLLQTEMLPAASRPATFIQFKTARALDYGVGGVFVNKGEGLPVNGIVELLLEEMGRYAISETMRDKLRSSLPLDLSLFANASGDIWTITQERVIKQTSWFMGFRRSRAELYDLIHRHEGFDLCVGNGLIGRTAEQSDDTPDSQIINALEVAYLRDLSNPSAAITRAAVLVDRYSSGSALSLRLEESEGRFGRRFQRYPAADLLTEASARRLAEDELWLHALPAKHHRYLTEWWAAIATHENQAVLLTDATEGLDQQPARCVRREWLPAGPVLTFREEP